RLSFSSRLLSFPKLLSQKLLPHLHPGIAEAGSPCKSTFLSCKVYLSQSCSNGERFLESTNGHALIKLIFLNDLT
ncbi:hypothetical protein GIB67_041967, partial [Kingdonia uniflora]